MWKICKKKNGRKCFYNYVFLQYTLKFNSTATKISFMCKMFFQLFAGEASSGRGDSSARSPAHVGSRPAYKPKRRVIVRQPAGDKAQGSYQYLFIKWSEWFYFFTVWCDVCFCLFGRILLFRPHFTLSVATTNLL